MKKYMKFAAATLVACLFALALTACSQPSPTSVTTDALNAVKVGGLSAITSFCDGDVGIGNTTSTYDSFSSGEGVTDEQKALMEDFAKKMLSYDFSVSNQQVNGESATVDVTFKTYDCGTPFKQAIGEYLQKALAAAFSDSLSGKGQATSASQYSYYFYDALKTQLAAVGDKSQEYKGTVSLQKKDGSWKITAVDDNVKDGVTGGLFTCLSSVSDSMSKLSGNASS